MMMSPSSTPTSAAATTTVVDADTNSVVTNNQATFQVDADLNPATADLSCICDESPPVRPFDSQKTAVEAYQ